MTRYKVKRPFKVWKNERGLADPDYILVLVTGGRDWSELDDEMRAFVLGRKNAVRGRYLVLEKVQMEPLINRFDELGKLSRLEFRLLPGKA